MAALDDSSETTSVPPFSLYAAMPPKMRRQVDADVATLFSLAGFIPKISIEEIKRLGPFHPTVHHEHRIVFLSEEGARARRRIQDALSNASSLSGACSKREVEGQVTSTHNHFISCSLEPTGEEFVSHVGAALLGSVKDYQFLAVVDGIKLEDVSVIELGPFRVQQPDRGLLEQIRFGGHLPLDLVFDGLKDALWLVGPVEGSPDLAVERFRHRSKLAVGLLGIFGVIRYPGAIWRTHVRAIAPQDDHGTVRILRCDHDGGNPVLSIDYGQDEALPVTAESLVYVNEHCFFRQLAGLIDKREPNDLQSTIRTAMYWFGDAYQDREPTMKFVKLWSCVECFFSIVGDGLTDANARGVASVLTYAGYGVTSPADYQRTKARLKKLYGLRSKAVHGGKIGHVGKEDLDNFSRWVAWVIVSMMMLSEFGFQTRKQVHEKVTRIDPGRGGGLPRLERLRQVIAEAARWIYRASRLGED